MEYSELIFPVEPCPKPRQTRGDKWKSRPPVIRYRNFQNAMLYYANEFNYKVEEELSLTFIIPIPKSYTKKKKQQLLNQPHVIKPDLDNLIKAFKDALCKDDSHVWKYREMQKIWGEDGKIIVHNIN
jgi:Holliday junction resolvase RusA-like endonuclease